MPFHTSLKVSLDAIRYKRLKIEYEKFINNYYMYNFDIIRSTEEIKRKFELYEFNMFWSIISDCEKEGKYIENLENFSNTLDSLYFKFLKYKYTRRILVISLLTLVSVANILAVVIYPIMLTISENLIYIFK